LAPASAAEENVFLLTLHSLTLQPAALQGESAEAAFLTAR